MSLPSSKNTSKRNKPTPTRPFPIPDTSLLDGTSSSPSLWVRGRETSRGYDRGDERRGWRREALQREKTERGSPSVPCFDPAISRTLEGSDAEAGNSHVCVIPSCHCEIVRSLGGFFVFHSFCFLPLSLIHERSSFARNYLVTQLHTIVVRSLHFAHSVIIERKRIPHSFIFVLHFLHPCRPKILAMWIPNGKRGKPRLMVALTPSLTFFPFQISRLCFYPLLSRTLSLTDRLSQRRDCLYFSRKQRSPDRTSFQEFAPEIVPFF